MEQDGKGTQAVEIAATLTGRRFGLCGFDPGEVEKISRFLVKINAVAVPFHENLLGGSARFCDAILLKFSNVSPETLRTAARERVAPILATGPIEAILEGAGGAYLWPCDFLGEPWTEAELHVRLFRVLESKRNRPVPVPEEARVEPLVLLADDDPSLLALVGVTLRNDGIGCRVVKDGLSALRLARQLDPDLIMLDVKMPMLNGFEVLEAIRRDPVLQTLPVIFLTGCDDNANVMRGAVLEADDYLSKPMSPVRLLSRVKRLLATHNRNSPRWARRGGRLSESVAKPWMLCSSAEEETVEKA